VTMCAL